MTENPITQVSPESLDELYDRDPLELTRTDRDTIVAALRAQRLRWMQDQTEDPKTKRKADKKATREATSGVELDQLDIEI